ncbi:TetR/AcrR family transcriptional regulator [Streptomyces sp. NPDC003077]|uniref:TetR/AcrR family transcriptional regulator n=1 Tax=Streptomyces sp. NPDC003077 TaxID=3154443 RepID=UPI0033A417A7
MVNEGPGLRERKKRATRLALSEAAIRLAARLGFEHVTVEAISEEAGVSARTFFNYFKTREEAFVMADPEAGKRIRRAVREAPAHLSALEVVRETMAAELTQVEEKPELWNLMALVLSRSPELTARFLTTQADEEAALARALADRLRRQESAAHGDIDLYTELLAAVTGTAIRVSVTHWSARTPKVGFLTVFRRVFDQLAAGLGAPAPGPVPDPADRTGGADTPASSPGAGEPSRERPGEPAAGAAPKAARP